MQRATCIVTCYNYGRFIQKAVASISSQDTPFSEIIVVDDASTDDSGFLISEIARHDTRIKIIRHDKNAGQLAAFESAVLQSNGDLLFFLDADDVYAPSYLAIAMNIYQNIPQADFLFCGNIQFSKEIPYSLLSRHESSSSLLKVNDLGLSIVRTLQRKAFIGAPTSCLSMRRWVAERIFPLPLHKDWVSRADDCLVFGASLAGARKLRIEANLVGYRLHGQNAYAQNRTNGDPSVFFKYQIAVDRLFYMLRRRFQLQKDIVKLAHLEFKTIPNPCLKDLREYVAYILINGAKDAGRLRGVLVAINWYFRSIVNGSNRILRTVPETPSGVAIEL
jgi:glycosyltransferase involved in cell wall biosynthesis